MRVWNWSHASKKKAKKKHQIDFSLKLISGFINESLELISSLQKCLKLISGLSNLKFGSDLKLVKKKPQTDFNPAKMSKTDLRIAEKRVRNWSQSCKNSVWNWFQSCRMSVWNGFQFCRKGVWISRMQNPAIGLLRPTESLHILQAGPVVVHF